MSCLSQKTLDMTLLTDAIAQNIFGGSECARICCFDAHFDSSVKLCTQFLSHVMMCSRKSWPSLPKQSFNSRLQLFFLCQSKVKSCLGTQRMLFWKRKCSWIIVFTIPTERLISCEMSQQIMHRLSSLKFSTWWMFPGVTAESWEPLWSESSLMDMWPSLKRLQLLSFLLQHSITTTFCVWSLL